MEEKEEKEKKNSITIIDNRTGKSFEIPLIPGLINTHSTLKIPNFFFI